MRYLKSPAGYGYANRYNVVHPNGDEDNCVLAPLHCLCANDISAWNSILTDQANVACDLAGKSLPKCKGCSGVMRVRKSLELQTTPELARSL